MSEPLGILMVDDHTIFRSGFAKLIAETRRFRVDAEAANIEDALACLRQVAPLSLVVLDINLSGQNALDHIGSMREIRPEIPILVISMYPPDQFASAAYRAGANGYLTKDASPPELLEALNELSSGRNYHNSAISDKPGSDAPDSLESGYPHERLSERELEILKLIANGDSLTDIGQKMFLSVKTVSTYRGRILEKLGMTNNAELIKYALTHGLTLSDY